MAEPTAVIQATLAPAFLISGTSVFLNFTQNRLFRVVDHARAMAREGDEPARQRYLRRARLLRNAIALGVLTVAFTVGTAILVMASDLVLPRLAGAAPFAFALAMLALFLALCFVLWDTVLSVRFVAAER
jgi:predicted small integral membrane protein